MGINVGCNGEFGGRRGQRHGAALAGTETLAVRPMLAGGFGVVGAIVVTVRADIVSALGAAGDGRSRRAGMPQGQPTAPQPRKEQGQEEGEGGKAGA